MGRKNKYGFEKNFTKFLNGPFPFFIIQLRSPLHKSAIAEALREELVKAAGDGFQALFSYYYLLKISRLIEKQLLPETASFIDRYFDDVHCIIFCKRCIQSVREIYEVLEKEALGNHQWKLIEFVINHYEVLGLGFPWMSSFLKMKCTLTGHPSHELSTDVQPNEDKADSDLGVLSELTTAEHTGEEDSEVNLEPIHKALMELYICKFEQVSGMLNSPSTDEHTGGEESERTNYAELSLHRAYSESEFELDWEPIEKALQKLYICNFEQVSAMLKSLSTDITDLQSHVAEMTQRHSDSQKRIYKQLEQSIVSHLAGICFSINEHEGYTFLQEVSKNWILLLRQVTVILPAFMPVGPSFYTARHLAHTLFEKYLVEPGNVVTAMVTYIRTERAVHHDLMCELIEMLMLYPSSLQRFEIEFLEASRVFYETDSAKISELCFIASTFSSVDNFRTCKVYHQLEDYFQHLHEVLDIELQFAKSYLGANSELLLLASFHNYYLTSNSSWIQSCLCSSFRNHDYAALEGVRRLLSHLPKGPVQMQDWLVSLVQSSLVLDIADPNDDVVNGEHLLVLRRKYDQLINESLTNDNSLEHAVNTTFRRLVNSSRQCARYMSAYIDSRLRQTATLQMQQDIQEAFRFVVKYVNSAAFNLFCWHYMADRLIERASSRMAERNLIEMLKVEYGNAFTDKMENMLNEMDSQQQISERSNSIFPNDVPSTSFMILDSRFWPMELLELGHFPLNIRRITERFEAQYLKLESNRNKKVWWQARLGSARLVVTSSNGQRHEVVVTIPQMSVLVLFNTSDSLTFREIQHATGIVDANLRTCLSSLLSPDGSSILSMIRHSKNELLLNKETQEAPMDGECLSSCFMNRNVEMEFSEDDSFCLNEQFNGQVDRLSQKHEFETEKLAELVEQAQKHHIDAATVRIMKNKKYLDHHTLVAEVKKALEPLFTTTSAAVKGRIEKLIGDEYLERDQNDTNCYRYL